jgi:hypothetical protein
MKIKEKNNLPVFGGEKTHFYRLRRRKTTTLPPLAAKKTTCPDPNFLPPP